LRGHIVENVMLRVQTTDFTQSVCIEKCVAVKHHRSASKPLFDEFFAREPGILIRILAHRASEGVDGADPGPHKTDIVPTVNGLDTGLHERWLDDVVVLKQQEILPVSLIKTEIEILVRCERRLLPEVADSVSAEPSNHSLGIVGGAVVGHDDLQWAIRLCERTLQRFYQIAMRAVVCGYTYGHQRA
jgi:hypothetical protein